MKHWLKLIPNIARFSRLNYTVYQLNAGCQEQQIQLSLCSLWPSYFICYHGDTVSWITGDDYPLLFLRQGIRKTIKLTEKIVSTYDMFAQITYMGLCLFDDFCLT